MRRWMTVLVAGALLLSGCVTHHSYRSEAPGHFKGYYMADGTYVKVHPTKGYVQGYVLRDGRHVKVHPSHAKPSHGKPSHAKSKKGKKH